MNNGASRPPAVTGSITSDSIGMPTTAKPPPNAPFMKQIRKTPAKATRIVAVVSSMARLPTDALDPPLVRASTGASVRLSAPVLGLGALKC
jgi:hypothetical protein